MSLAERKYSGREILGWALLTLGYSVFVVYGSLVPLEYKSIPFADALQQFQEIRSREIGVWKRMDWATNILLFIPLGFLWLGLFWPHKSGFNRILTSLLIFLAVSLLSISIEFTQLFFPQRTTSQNDIAANVIGTTIGIAIWWWRGSLFRRWIADILEARGPTQLAEKILWIYLAGLFLYNLLPLDLTINPVEIYHKWNSGKVNLIPFGFHVADPAQRLYDLVTDILIWVPVSLLWVLSGRRRGIQAWIWVVLAATFLELMQLFVFSRVSDITDILTAMAGAGLGVWAIRFIPIDSQPEVRSQPSGYRNLALTGAACLVWTLILMAVFWYPYDFKFDWQFLRERAELFSRVPLHAYYYGTEFRAITEVLHKILFFLPLGAILAYGRPEVTRSLWRTVYGILVLGVLLAVPFGIELGQVALPFKNPDGTDLILEFVGGCTGYLGLIFLRKRLTPNIDHVNKREI